MLHFGILITFGTAGAAAPTRHIVSGTATWQDAELVELPSATCPASMSTFKSGGRVDNTTIPLLTLQPLVPRELNTSSLPGYVLQVNITLWGQLGCPETPHNQSEVLVTLNSGRTQYDAVVATPTSMDACHDDRCASSYHMPGVLREEGWDDYYWFMQNPNDLTINPCCYRVWTLAEVEYSVLFVIL